MSAPPLHPLEAYRRGVRIATLLARGVSVSHRVPLPASFPSEELVPVLQSGGAGSIAWWGLRDTPLAADPAVQPLRDAYHWHALQAGIANIELERLTTRVADAGVRPLLGKGWAVARLYQAPGLRPFGDFDLYVDEREHAPLRRVLDEVTGARTYDVDLHCGASYLDDRPFAVLFDRSVLLPVGSGQVRVFGPEDLLRLACLHTMAEGAIRPPWLCDIAVMVGALPRGFDWDHFASGDPLRTEWAFAAIGLAHRVLGVDVSAVPEHRLVQQTPDWLVTSVLQTWARAPRSKGGRTPMARMEDSGSAVRALLERWPTPIEATVGVRGRINGWPRLPYQIAEVVRRTTGFLRQRATAASVG